MALSTDDHAPVHGRAADNNAPEKLPRMGAGEYLATRLTTLKPPMHAVPNPFKILALLNTRQWLFFLLGFLGWTVGPPPPHPGACRRGGLTRAQWDAFDFFTVSLTVKELAENFERSTADITWGITRTALSSPSASRTLANCHGPVVLMMRSVGAIIFGLAADRYGRRWPYVANMVLFIILELATGFTQSYSQFLGVRALYGIAMGGLYGNATATALEDCPAPARGLLSGLLQQGYAFGYLLATVFARGLVNTTPSGWRPLFWFGACPPVLLIVFRLCMPETQAYLERSTVRGATGNLAGTFAAEGKVALRRHWKLLVYMVLLMAGFNFMSVSFDSSRHGAPERWKAGAIDTDGCVQHGSQDLYPTLLQNQYSQTPDQVTITQVVANLGAMTGGTIVGYLSQMFGRRFSIIVMSVVGGALLYPYSFTPNLGIIAAAFFEQFCVQGAWGVIPIHLMELSPGSFRTFVVGTSYQLGNLVSSASATIEATIGERFPLAPKGETKRYNYGIVICIVRFLPLFQCSSISYSRHRFDRSGANIMISSWPVCTSTSSSSPSSAPRRWAATLASRPTPTWPPLRTLMPCAPGAPGAATPRAARARTRRKASGSTWSGRRWRRRRRSETQARNIKRVNDNERAGHVGVKLGGRAVSGLHVLLEKCARRDFGDFGDELDGSVPYVFTGNMSDTRLLL